MVFPLSLNSGLFQGVFFREQHMAEQINGICLRGLSIAVKIRPGVDHVLFREQDVPQQVNGVGFGHLAVPIQVAQSILQFISCLISGIAGTGQHFLIPASEHILAHLVFRSCGIRRRGHVFTEAILLLTDHGAIIIQEGNGGLDDGHIKAAIAYL